MYYEIRHTTDGLEGHDIRGLFNKSHRALVLAIALIVVFVVAIIHYQNMNVWLNNVLDWCKKWGLWSTFMLGFFTAGMQILMLPMFPLMLGAGAVYAKMYGLMLGCIIGTVSIFSGFWIGSVVSFIIGRFFVRDIAQTVLEKHYVFRVVNGMIAEEGVKIVFLARMIPILPAELFNYACSVLHTLTVQMYALGCVGSVVPVGFWVCISAQATLLSLSSDDSGYNAQVNRTTNETLNSDVRSRVESIGSLLWIFNTTFLAMLSCVVYSAYNRYSAYSRQSMISYPLYRMQG